MAESVNNQIKELKQAFDEFDTDRSGSIDVNELRSVLRKLDLGVTDADVKSLMTSMDSNKSGTIEFYEFARVMGSNYYAKRDKNDIIAEFKKADKDHNGVLTKAEFNEVMKKFRGNMTKQECDEAFAKIDKDKSGTINLLEFIRFLK